MNLEEIEKLARELDTGGDSIPRQVAEILCKLRVMDAEALEAYLNISKAGMVFMPKEMHPAVEIMQQDIALIKAFVEMAKKYDRSDEGMKAFESVFGNLFEEKEVKKGEEVKND